MANQRWGSLADYERFVTNLIKAWSHGQRTVLAAAMAERWLPAYETFSEENEWGDPASFQDAVQSIWNCVLGHKVTPKDSRLLEKRVEENTPHMDDFDAYEALTTSQMIHHGLKCCATADNTEDVVSAMMMGFEGIAECIYTEPQEVPPNAWQWPHVQNELAKQLKLMKLIGDMVLIDEQQIAVLRQKLVASDLVGAVAPRPEPARGLTNEAIFEQYRRAVETDLRSKKEWDNNLRALSNDAGAAMMSYIGEWARRYVRRKQSIEQGPMLDVAAHDALLVKYSTQDAAVQGDPGWDQEARFWIDTCYGNPHAGFGVDAAEKPHRYGPSFRRLCIEGKLAGNSDKYVWNGIFEWANHRSPAWEEEDRRKKKRLAYTAPELGELITRKIHWDTTDDVDHPWGAEVEGKTWRVRLNDFPDELMYTLIINDAIAGSFHDWPDAWTRDNRR